MSVDAITYPGISIEFAEASRIQGNRLLGRDAFHGLMDSWGIPFTDVVFSAIADQTALENWSSENAITNVDGVVLPDGNVIADVDAGSAEIGGASWHLTTGGSSLVQRSQVADDVAIQMDADAGVWQLSYNTEFTEPLAANVTASQLQDALNMLPNGPGDFEVTVTGSAPVTWNVSSVSSGTLDVNDFATVAEGVPLQGGITAGLYQFGDDAANGNSSVANVPWVGLGGGDKVVFGLSLIHI